MPRMLRSLYTPWCALCVAVHVAACCSASCSVMQCELQCEYEWVISRIWMIDVAHINVTRMNTSWPTYVQHQSFICVISLIHMRDMIRSYVWHASWHMNYSYEEYLIRAKHCNTLQHTATHCNTLRHTATHRNTLQHTTTQFSTLHQTTTHSNTTAANCNTLQHPTTRSNALHHTASH